MSFETPPRPRWLLRVSLALGTVLVLVLGVVVVVGLVQRCDTGVWRAGEEGECVGVTDGSYPFSSELADVEGKILAENEQAERSSQYVTVAVLMPMTADPDASLSTQQIKGYLQGAHIAQQAANSDAHGLKVRLLLANEGRYEFAWEQVTEQLLRMVDVPGKVDAPENLVAVTGLGLSSSQTVDGARKLSDAGIPMIGYLSANRFNNTDTTIEPPLRTLTRVSPSLDQELASVAAEAGGKLSKAFLVEDRNPDDYYTSDLRDGFLKYFGQAWKNGGEKSGPYSGGKDQYNLNNQFRNIANRLCDDELDTVLYAGRSNLLPYFVDHVRSRSCARDRPITVVTGSESTDLQLNDPGRGGAPVSVLYASASDPKALEAPANRFLPSYLKFRDELRARFDSHARESNWSVMGHDATLAATTAAQNSVGQEKSVPIASQVGDSLALLNSRQHPVFGASGHFYLNPDGDRVSGPIPVLERNEFGDVEVLDLGGLDD